MCFVRPIIALFNLGFTPAVGKTEIMAKANGLVSRVVRRRKIHLFAVNCRFSAKY